MPDSDLTMEVRYERVGDELKRIVRKTGDQIPPLSDSAMILERAAIRNIEERGRGLWEPGAEHLSISYLAGLGRDKHVTQEDDGSPSRTRGPLSTLGYRQMISAGVRGDEAFAGGNHPFLPVHEEGADIRIPEITPKKPGGVLAFPDPETGDTIFTTKVKAHDVRIPARPIFALTPEEEALIVKRFEEHNR